MALKPESFAFTAMLGLLAALPPLSIDMGLPGIPEIEANFPDAANQGPLTLSLFLIGFAAAPLLAGPLADRFGRRPTLLVGLGVFVLAAIACTAAPSFPSLLGFRLVQGIAAGACVILPLAIVRDLFEGAKALQRLSQVTALVGLAPMIAPVFGAWAMGLSNWRTIYALQAGTGIILLVVAARGFAESLPAEGRRPFQVTKLVSIYGMVLADRSFRLLAIVYCLCFGCMFSFIAGSPAVMMGELSLSSQLFSVLFAISSGGVLVGSLISGRLSRRRVMPRNILSFGLGLMALAAVALFAIALFGVLTIYTLMPLVFLVIFCFGLTAPSANHEALRGLPHVAGVAAGLIRSLQMVMGALASAAIAALQPIGQPGRVMTAIMAASVVAAAAVWLRAARAGVARGSMSFE